MLDRRVLLARHLRSKRRDQTGAELVKQVNTEMRKRSVGIDDMLAYIQRECPDDVSGAIVDVTLRGKNASLVISNASAMHRLSCWLRANEVALKLSCRNPPTNIRIKVGCPRRQHSSS